jgi:glycopeptide antibiotics resistance protein
MGLHPHPRAYLLEFRLASPARLAVDVIVNVAMFVPLGWLLTRSLGGRAASALARVLIVAGFCGGLSLAMETLQFFLTTRYSSLIDVLANTLGAVAGAVIAYRWRR